jgi:hypothetical protein
MSCPQHLSVGLLAENRITDNIQDLAVGMTMEPLPLEGWEIEPVGPINPFRVVIHAEDLLEMEQVECEMDTSVLGQRPKSTPRSPGTPWNQGPKCFTLGRRGQKVSVGTGPLSSNRT